MRYLLERLADLEHQQWSHIINYCVENPERNNWNRWLRQSGIPYGKLTEKEKESDREWARKVLAIIQNSHVVIDRKQLQDQIIRLGQLRAGNISRIWDAGHVYGLLCLLEKQPTFKTRDDAYDWAEKNICKFLSSEEARKKLLVVAKK